MRAADLVISLSPIAMTASAVGVVRSIGGGSGSWQTTSSWMNLPRLTIEFAAGSDAAHKNDGWVRIPARVWVDGQVAATKSVPVPVKGSPYNVARRRLTNIFCDMTRSVTLPP